VLGVAHRRPVAGELIAEAVLAMEFSASARTFSTITHPTLARPAQASPPPTNGPFTASTANARAGSVLLAAGTLATVGLGVYGSQRRPQVGGAALVRHAGKSIGRVRRVARELWAATRLGNARQCRRFRPILESTRIADHGPASSTPSAIARRPSRKHSHERRKRCLRNIFTALG
jgi:hypothetical protein